MVLFIPPFPLWLQSHYKTLLQFVAPSYYFYLCYSSQYLRAAVMNCVNISKLTFSFVSLRYIMPLVCVSTRVPFGCSSKKDIFSLSLSSPWTSFIIFIWNIIQSNKNGNHILSTCPWDSRDESAQNLVNLKINVVLGNFFPFFPCLCLFFLPLQSIFFLPNTSLLLTQKYWGKVPLFSGN